MHNNLAGPTKAVCYREVFTIRRVCYKRFVPLYHMYDVIIAKYIL